MTTDLAPGMRRVFVNAGVGGLASSRWADVRESASQLAGWLRAGLVSDVGPRGESPPDTLPRGCCGG